MFIQGSTSAQNVADVAGASVSWQNTGKFIQDRNRLNVVFVANDLHGLEILLLTAEFTVETNRTNVSCVTRYLMCLNILADT